MHLGMQTWSRQEDLKFKPNIRLEKKGDLSDFECGLVAGARWAGLSISETADLLGFSMGFSMGMVRIRENIQ